MTSKIFFIILDSDNKNRLVCDLTDKIYNENRRMVFYIKNTTIAKDFDQKLWIWKQSSFIPHVFTEKLESSFEEPVVITPEIENVADYDTLLMYDPAPMDIINQFKNVIDFAEKYDQAALQSSRDRYRSYQEKNWTTESLKPGEFLLLDL